ncbi:IpaB/EvcA family protein [Apilactobacillus micheneri]|uniref:IpaB/EvcA family protein n=1 Tax=Apilactobacillus micheneri TaxID=1899430 RepID=A0ABY2YV56_9LACO|nr:IpaB/EvcA family protein [Apilactobacillus micheneri]TPR23503.1 IpaB/EvcA family protein [Apilactobacillus micheneri]TPR24845.1 IpaB/EvcA family protein [Apilactobacillus micheneri]TPR27328.1 IpaB/EvcA family protein [Apilactobacillus micheneri]TPR28712.1 IpaB/EvcA family protein [Apilactobacillus micheneri]TPR28770.1 IpaB/EvcA family protein [Apilactobacillus micheneri]
MDIQLNKETQGLINVVNKYFPGKIEVQFIGQLQSGYVRHDQAQVVQDGKNLFVQISDLSAPDYTASHELIHLLMTLRGFPQLFFSLSTGNEKIDEQLQVMGTELFDIVSHFVVVSEQRKHNLINDDIEAMYLKGVQNTIEPESDELDNSMELRLLTLIDARVFYGDTFDKKVRATLEKDYPVALKAADKIYEIITEKPTDSPFGLRRNVVKLFKAFDKQLIEWGLPALHNTEYATISSVVSERQLNLNVQQMFEIFHSEMHESNTNRRAYVGFNKSDDQNSFVVPAPTGMDDSPAYFKKLYALKVKDLFKELKMPYIIRK